MSVLEAGPSRGEEGFDELGLPQLAQEAQRVTADVLVGVLQVVADAVAEAKLANQARCTRGRRQAQANAPDQDHLLLELAGRVELGTDLIVEVEQLLEGLVLGGHDEADDVHEQVGHRVAVEHDGQDALHRLDLCLVTALLELRAQVREGGHVGRIVLVHQAVSILEEARHGGGVAVGSEPR